MVAINAITKDGNYICEEGFNMDSKRYLAVLGGFFSAGPFQVFLPKQQGELSLSPPKST